MMQLQKSELADAEWIDLQVLGELKQEIGADVLKEVIEVYLTELGEHVEQMQQARHQNDWVALGKLAHCIKSSSGSLGALRLYQAALSVETLCRKGAGEQCVPDYDNFLDFAGPTRDALLAYLEN
ncbi:Hpt domain-containing protein [Plesiomonas shigelloides]|uniref:Hpt domain-containing protein n=1 Tax=Plesiomonas shigelloides TaxID=703 RepID=UPI0031B7C91E